MARATRSSRALSSWSSMGAVRAMVGGRDYGESQFKPRHARWRQPGSSFKVYTYAAAMEKGMTPENHRGGRANHLARLVAQNYAANMPAGNDDERAREIDQHYSGPPRQGQARLPKSLPRPPREWASRPRFAPTRPCRSATSEVTVLDQATAYAVFPAGGFQSQRHGISQILNYDGDISNDFGRDAPAARRVLSEQAVSSMNRILTQIPVIGTARRAALDNGIVTGGKTGTTQAYRDDGSSASPATTPRPSGSAIDDYTSTDEMTGGSLPAMTFKRLMDYAEQGSSTARFPGIEIAPAKPAKSGSPKLRSRRERPAAARAAAVAIRGRNPALEKDRRHIRESPTAQARERPRRQGGRARADGSRLGTCGPCPHDKQ